MLLRTHAANMGQVEKGGWRTHGSMMGMRPCLIVFKMMIALSVCKHLYYEAQGDAPFTHNASSHQYTV